MTYPDEVRNTDFGAEKLYVIYKGPISYIYLDVFQINGILEKRFNIEDSLDEHDIELLNM